MHQDFILEGRQFLPVEVPHILLYATSPHQILIVVDDQHSIFGFNHVHFQHVGALTTVFEGSYCIFNSLAGASSVRNSNNLPPVKRLLNKGRVQMPTMKQ